MLNKQQYKKDLVYGLNNEKLAREHIELYMKKYLEDESIIIGKLKDNHIFDFKVKYNNIYIELKSRRNTIKKYPTQMIGANKIKYGRTKMEKDTNTKILYFYLLEHEYYKDKKSLYLYVDNKEELKMIKCGNYKRNDKTSNLYLIPNTKLKFISSF